MALYAVGVLLFAYLLVQTSLLIYASSKPHSITLFTKNLVDTVFFDSGRQPREAVFPLFSPTADAILRNPPTLTRERVAETGTVAPKHEWSSFTVKRNDSLSHIFKRHGSSLQVLHEIMALKDAKLLKKIYPGQKISIATDEQGTLLALRYNIDKLSTLHIDRENGDIRSEIVTRTPEIRVRYKKATIQSTLVEAAQEVDINLEIIFNFADIFGWQVDFTRDIRSGNHFAIIYEELYLDDKKLGNGNILAAELFTRKRLLQAIQYINENGDHNYYDAAGNGIQGTFLRSPIKYGRVTSSFSNRRFHPILKKWKAHRGVDYGAPKGTPIRSTGDGVVIKARYLHGYGNTIILRHAQKHTTLYAHLHKFAKGIKSGARIQQGEVIGYVGQTGWTTGPHLHYEFRIHGVHRNPLTVEFPKSAPIPDRYKSDFLAFAKTWTNQLQQRDLFLLVRNNTEE